MKVVKCKRCGREFEVEKATGFKYCKDCLIEIKKERQSRQNKSDFQKRQEKLLEGVEGVDYIIDLWNGYATKLINGKWMEVHHPGKTIEDYKKDFPDAQLVCSSTNKKISDNTKSFMNTPEMKKFYSERISGDKNPNARCNTTEEQRKSISPFSKNFKGYEGMNDDEINEHIANCIKLDKVGRTTNQVEYWINKGYCEDEARKLVTERQRTFTLEKCIEKYGKTEGLKVWQERQFKWQMNYRHLNYSKISQELFWNIYFKLDEDECFFAQNNNGQMDISGRNYEKRVKTDNSVVSLDFYYPKTNSIIEFDGDYWHSETREYVNKTRDINRDNSLKNVGYNRILHIKESEYNKDKEGIIQKCIDFLLN